MLSAGVCNCVRVCVRCVLECVGDGLLMGYLPQGFEQLRCKQNRKKIGVSVCALCMNVCACVRACLCACVHEKVSANFTPYKWWVCLFSYRRVLSNYAASRIRRKSNAGSAYLNGGVSSLFIK